MAATCGLQRIAAIQTITVAGFFIFMPLTKITFRKRDFYFNQCISIINRFYKNRTFH
jgi:hypothetical protein